MENQNHYVNYKPLDTIDNSNLLEVNKSKKVEVSYGSSKNFEFPIDKGDIMCTITRNNRFDGKENLSNVISKIFIVRDLKFISLNDLNIILEHMRIEKLNIFSIGNGLHKKLNTINFISTDDGTNKGSKINFIEMTEEHFITFLNEDNKNFLEYNKYSLYIIRNGNFLDIKKLFARINGFDVNLGRGGPQKAHLLSPLDFRLSAYLMAMFNFDYKLISYLNTFNDISKDRYLSYLDWLKTSR